MIEIRKLGVDDAELYREMRLRSVIEHPEAFLTSEAEERAHGLAGIQERFRTLWSRPDSCVFMAFRDDDAVGMIGVFRSEREKTRHTAQIWGMYVAPDGRRQGVGRLLVDRAIHIASSWPGVERITLRVGTRNRGANRLYRLAGFKTFGTEQQAMKLGGRYLDEDLMVYWLIPEP